MLLLLTRMNYACCEYMYGDGYLRKKGGGGGGPPGGYPPFRGPPREGGTDPTGGVWCVCGVGVGGGGGGGGGGG